MSGCFYSKLVRLKVRYGAGVWPEKDGFYSKLVRLKANQSPICEKVSSFYSKLVRLKDLLPAYRYSTQRFYSKLVRLKVAIIFIVALAAVAVSIPNWCD